MALKEVMDRNNVRGKDLAAAVGVAPETVSRWRAGLLAIGGTNLTKVLDYLRGFEPGLENADLLREEPATTEAK